MLPDAEPSREQEGWRRFAANPELVVSQILLIVLVAISTLQVTMRYLFNAPLEWTQEVSGLVLVWMTFVGAVGLTRHNLHARVELLEEITTSGRLLRSIDFVLDLIAIVFLVCVVIGSWQLMDQMSYERTPALRMPVTVKYLAVFGSAALMALFLTVKNVLLAVRIARGRP